MPSGAFQNQKLLLFGFFAGLVAAVALRRSRTGSSRARSTKRISAGAAIGDVHFDPRLLRRLVEGLDAAHECARLMMILLRRFATEHSNHICPKQAPFRTKISGLDVVLEVSCRVALSPPHCLRACETQLNSQLIDAITKTFVKTQVWNRTGVRLVRDHRREPGLPQWGRPTKALAGGVSSLSPARMPGTSGHAQCQRRTSL